MLQLSELEELRLDAYENARIYKEKTKRWHDSKILRKEFHIGQSVLLFNFCLRLFSGKLKSRWFRPYEVTQIFSKGLKDLEQKEVDDCERVLLR